MNRRWLWNSWVLLISALLLSGCQSKLERISRQANKLINDNNFTDLLPLYTDDVILITDPFCPVDDPCIGKIPLVVTYRMEVEGNMIADIVDLKVDKNVVTSRMEVTGDLNKVADVDRFIMNVTQTFNDDKISKVVEEYDLSDPQTVVFAEWMKTKHP